MPIKPNRPRIVIVTGPTAVGKSGLAHNLAQKLGGEIINADSMQVYRLMDIGTAKPSLKERKEVPYHLIDIVDPDQPFDASAFRVQAGEVIRNLHSREVPILVVGGTGLYLRVLQKGIFSCPAPKMEIREQWKKEASGQGPEFLWTQLKEKDPSAADRIHPRDTLRLIRALEVLELTGRPISQCQQWDLGGDSEFNILWIGLSSDRDTLYQRINKRADQMIAQGFLKEVQGLLQRGYSPELKALKSLGYRHLVGVLQGRWELEEALEILKRDTRHYAKRQLTWLARESNLNWYSWKEFDTIHLKISDFLKCR
ncbi:MAG: tRNA (adenosine(37)-N6)-dimethylallyltransferase MiaA [Desulfobacca sp.]|nr:tRNA (adenosine(37)-N6)-dimethylallyltransferase MiaA [Desulfobacca sp.]